MRFGMPGRLWSLWLNRGCVGYECGWMDDGWIDGYRVRLGALGRDKSWISPCGLEIEDWEFGIGIIGLLDTYLARYLCNRALV